MQLGQNMTGMGGGHNMTGMGGGHNMTGMGGGHNMTGMGGGHNMTGMGGEHNMTGMGGGHNMTGMGGGQNMTGTGGGHDMTGTGGGHDMTGMGGGHTGGHSSEHSMKMFFHTGASEYILFEEILTSSNTSMIGACLVVFVVAILFEGLKSEREILMQKYLRKHNKELNYTLKELDGSDEGRSCSQMRTHMVNKGHFLQAFLRLFEVFISYCLMLVFMTFNVWLCLAVVLGASFGYLLFGWRRNAASDPNEHCH